MEAMIGASKGASNAEEEKKGYQTLIVRWHGPKGSLTAEGVGISSVFD